MGAARLLIERGWEEVLRVELREHLRAELVPRAQRLERHALGLLKLPRGGGEGAAGRLGGGGAFRSTASPPRRLGGASRAALGGGGGHSAARGGRAARVDALVELEQLEDQTPVGIELERRLLFRCRRVLLPPPLAASEGRAKASLFCRLLEVGEGLVEVWEELPEVMRLGAGGGRGGGGGGGGE